MKLNFLIGSHQIRPSRRPSFLVCFQTNYLVILNIPDCKVKLKKKKNPNKIKRNRPTARYYR